MASNQGADGIFAEDTTRVLAVPVNDTESGYNYPARVRWTLAQDELQSYQDAAQFLNLNNIHMVCLQHEYGIFGGRAGSYILHLLRVEDAGRDQCSTLRRRLRQR